MEELPNLVEEASGGKKADGGKPRPSLFPKAELRELLLNRQRALAECDTPEWEDLWVAFLEDETDLLAGFVLLMEAPDTPSLARFLSDTLVVLELGAKKYGDYNWQKVSPERYVDAVGRHLLADGEGEKLDKESGVSHLAHVFCNCLFLIYLRDQKEDAPEPEKPYYRVVLDQKGNRSDTYTVYFRDGGIHYGLLAATLEQAIDKADAIAKERGLM